MIGIREAVLSACLFLPAASAEATPAGTRSPLVADPSADRGTDAILERVGEAWLKREWDDYAKRFVAPDGRVIDNGNKGISHSEGQGYAMLLATTVGNRAGFEAIWAWTEHHLFVRPDGLAAWKWDPQTGAVADKNNATDGDLLIAWALARAAHTFAEPRYTERARTIAQAIGTTLLKRSAAGPILLPAAFGFTAADQPDGPIVNLSYYVFPAFEALKSVARDIPWDEIAATGLRLVEASRFGPLRLPADWISIAGPAPKPARNFPATFGYDAIRIPLYLAWAARPEAGRPRFAGLWNATLDLGPFVIDLGTGAALRPLDGAGFKLIAALSACLNQGGPVPPSLTARRDDLYYPATLRLLCHAVIEERYPRCL